MEQGRGYSLHTSVSPYPSPVMSRTQNLLLPLVLVLLCSAPCTQAQVEADTTTMRSQTERMQDRTADTPPMNDAQLRESNTMMQRQMDRLDRDLRDLERQAGAARDADQRTALEGQIEQLRQQQRTLRTQNDELGSASATAYEMQRQGVMKSYNDLDVATQQARLEAASTPQSYRTLASESIDRFDENLAMLNERLDQMPEQDRARYAYQLIQLRNDRDKLARQSRTMRRANRDEFDTMRGSFTTDLSKLNADLRQTMDQVGTIMMAGDRMGRVRGDQRHGGGQVNDQTQNGQMQKDPMRDGQMRDDRMQNKEPMPRDSTEMHPRNPMHRDSTEMRHQNPMRRDSTGMRDHDPMHRDTTGMHRPTGGNH